MSDTPVNIQSSKTWVGSFLTPQTMLWILAGFVTLVIFWKDSHDNFDKTKELEKAIGAKADADDLRALKEQVNRIYSTNKEDREKENKAIEEVADWMHEQEGRRMAEEAMNRVQRR